MHLSSGIGFALLVALMVAAVFAGRAGDARVHVFPHQGHTEYQVNVFLDGRSLTSAEVERRYGLPVRGATVLTPSGMRDLVRQRESGPADGGEAFVRLHTQVSGGEEEVWLWPEN